MSSVLTDLGFSHKVPLGETQFISLLSASRSHFSFD